MLPLKQARRDVRVETVAERHHDAGTRKLKGPLPRSREGLLPLHEIDAPSVAGQKFQCIV